MSPRTDPHFARATEIFASFVRIPLESDIAEDLLRYFRVRKMWEEKQYTLVTDAELIFRNEARSRFKGATFDGCTETGSSVRSAPPRSKRDFRRMSEGAPSAFGHLPALPLANIPPDASGRRVKKLNLRSASSRLRRASPDAPNPSEPGKYENKGRKIDGGKNAKSGGSPRPKSFVGSLPPSGTTRRAAFFPR